MVILDAVLNTALEDTLRASGRTYTAKLIYSVGESTPEAITFEVPSGGVTQLSSSVFFSVDSGTEIIGVSVDNDLAVNILEYGVNPSETLSTDGTFTINNIIATLAD